MYSIRQTICFFNSRHVEIKNLRFIVKNVYGDLLPEGAQPIFFLFYEIPPNKMDANVHPKKRNPIDRRKFDL